jgi:hypothetical protein
MLIFERTQNGYVRSVRPCKYGSSYILTFLQMSLLLYALLILGCEFRVNAFVQLRTNLWLLLSGIQK